MLRVKFVFHIAIGMPNRGLDHGTAIAPEFRILPRKCCILRVHFHRHDARPRVDAREVRGGGSYVRAQVQDHFGVSRDFTRIDGVELGMESRSVDGHVRARSSQRDRRTAKLPRVDLDGGRCGSCQKIKQMAAQQGLETPQVRRNASINEQVPQRSERSKRS